MVLMMLSPSVVSLFAEVHFAIPELVQQVTEQLFAFAFTH